MYEYIKAREWKEGRKEEDPSGGVNTEATIQ